VTISGELRGDLESIRVGQLHVQKNDVRLKPIRKLDGFSAVPGLADDIEPLRLENGACRRPEAEVVVDDQNAFHA
jgi:hypothetical protein